MGDSSTADFLKVLLGHKSVPVGAKSLLVEIRIYELSIGVLVHNLVQVVPNVHLWTDLLTWKKVGNNQHLFEELGCDPWFKKKPTSSIHPPDLAVLAVEASSGWTEKEKRENREKDELVHPHQQDLTGLTTPAPA